MTVNFYSEKDTCMILETPNSEIGKPRTTPSIIPPKTVLIVDDQPVFSEGIVTLLRHRAGLLVCRVEPFNQIEMRKWIASPPAVILAGTFNHRKNTTDITYIKKLLSQFPRSQLLAVIPNDNAPLAIKLLSSGVSGVITRNEDYELFITAIENLCLGKLYLGKTLTQTIIRKRFPQQRHTLQAYS